MKKILISIVFLLLVTPAVAKTPTRPPEARIRPVEPVLTTEALIHRSALKWGVNERILRQTLECESGLNPNQVGDHGTSFGIAQFHNPWEWGITKEQAFDKEFAIDFAAKQFSLGQAPRWTCWWIQRAAQGTAQ